MRDRNGKAFFGASLLLAEDDPLNADIASRTLLKMGCRVTTASDGLLALRAWQEGEFDLILMDCEMAEMDGFEASRQIRAGEFKSNRAHTPIVALSAHAPADIRERCLAAGMDDALAKPFREPLLRDTLRRWIEGEDLSRQEEIANAPATQAGMGSSVDRVVLDSIGVFQGGNGRLLLKNVVICFADTASTQLSLLRQNHTKGETEEVRRIAHTLRSSSAALGAKSVSQCCAEIEMRASRGELAPLAGFLSVLERELSAAISHLREIVGEREELNRVAG